jgi:protein-S-isoprenylcysteine O-methyltransferase Ste14
MDRAALFALIACWVLWIWPFLAHKARERKRQAEITVQSANIGIAFQLVAYFFAWLPGSAPNPPALVAVGLLLGVFAIVISWTSIRALGKQLRLQAGLYSDHQLIHSGPYRMVRHPIYAGMLSIYVATALVRGTWSLALIGLVLFVAGTEIRVRVEDSLLALRFGEQFEQYKASVPAYIPFLR